MYYYKDTSKNQIRNREKLACVLLVLAPIVSVYATPVQAISYGDAFLVLSGILLYGVKTKKEVNQYCNRYILFGIYAFCITVVMTLVLRDINIIAVLKEMGTLIIYICVLVWIVGRINILYLTKVYKIIAVISALYLMLQFILYITTGSWIPGLIPNVMSDAGINTSVLLQNMSRASSFFKEPAHYCQFIAIPFVFSVFKKDKKAKDIIYALILGGSLVTTLSGNGLVVLTISIFGYWFLLVSSHSGSKFLKGIILGLGVILVAMFAVELPGVSEEIIGRITSGEILGNSRERVSGYVRIVRGYVVFNDFDFINKIFGVGVGNYEAYSIKNCFEALTKKTLYDFSYINGMQYYLVSTGVLGLYLYLNPVIKRIRNSHALVKTIILEFLVIISISATNKSSMWILFLTFIFCIPKKNTENFYKI